MEKTKQIWGQVLDLIKTHVSEQAFETWFKAVHLIDLKNGVATLQVPNRFHYEWVESKYGELIVSSFNNAPLHLLGLKALIGVIARVLVPSGIIGP